MRLWIVGLVLLAPACRFEISTESLLDVDAGPFDLLSLDVDAQPADLLSLDASSIHIQIHLDGATFVGTDYPGVWAADPGIGGACGPSVYSTTMPIHGTVDGPLFQEEVWGNPVRCTIGGLPSGLYNVRLYFAEVFFGSGCPGGGGVGSRIFDIQLEGTTVLSNFDIFSEGRCAASTSDSTGRPVIKSFILPISDGALDISLPAMANNGKISAIEISSVP